MDIDKLSKVLSRTLSAAVSVRSLARSIKGLKRLLSDTNKKTTQRQSKKASQLAGALSNLGYNRNQVDNALSLLEDQIDGSSLEELVKSALDFLNK